MERIEGEKVLSTFIDCQCILVENSRPRGGRLAKLQKFGIGHRLQPRAQFFLSLDCLS